MKPDRTNYEIWLVDYLDGNLKGEQVRQLISFLDENPDIKEEFEGVSATPIPVPEFSFVNRDSLYKSSDDLSSSQFDLLCAASLENDLHAEQQAELDKIISGNDERRRTSELFSKTKLIPPKYSYRYKLRLKKLTIAQKVIRISAISVSAAATLLVMFTLLNNPGVNVTEIAAGNLEKSNEEIMKQAVINVPGNKEVVKVPVAAKLTAKIHETVFAGNEQLKENITVADASIQLNDILRNNIPKIGGITEMPQENTLMKLSLVSINLTQAEPYDEEEGNAVGNFFTRLIREKILKSETHEKGNLKAYEVADAGITGINKLLGSNMTLKKTLDEKGEVKSVYFNSKLLKFNAPVKKAEPLE